MIIPPPLRRPVTMPPVRSLRNRDTERLRLALLMQSYPPGDSEGQRVSWTFVIFAAVVMFALGLCTGCGAVDDYLGGPEGAAIYLDVPDEALDKVRYAVERWEDAGVTPGTIAFAKGGSPVRLSEEELPAAECIGNDCTSAGQTRRSRTALSLVREVVVYRHATYRTWIHEIGHVLGAVTHVTCDPDVKESRRPVMCDRGGWLIDESSLSLICETAPCDRFVPEEPAQ